MSPPLDKMISSTDKIKCKQEIRGGIRTIVFIYTVNKTKESFYPGVWAIHCMVDKKEANLVSENN
jgi:hypothetical protein